MTVQASSLESAHELPLTENNTRRLEQVRPERWQNPKPASVYNLVVVGGGSAGLVTAVIAANLGARVALIEKHLMGGDCLNVGCVPSKSIIRSARVMGEIVRADDYGLEQAAATVNFGRVMERIRRVQADLSPNDSVWRYRDNQIDVFLGSSEFTSPQTIRTENETLKFKKAVIATGSRPAIPAIPGLAETGYLSNETVWNLMKQPKRLAVIGGGPIGCELAQAFRRLGSEVILFHNAAHILNREDADAAGIVQRAFVEEGIQLVLNSTVKQVARQEGAKRIDYECPSGAQMAIVDEILAAIGRSPNIEALGLDAAGVQVDPKRGVIVNDFLQTTNPNIYAAGDVAMAHKFTHAASAAARIVIQNAFFFGRRKLSALTMPWCTYTDPEIAHVGLYEHDARQRGLVVDTFTVHLDDNDRAVADGETEGFVKVHVKKGSDKILGATIVARTAGDMINEITLAIEKGIGLGALGNVIHPYPTQAEAIARVAGLYTRSRLTPTVKRLFSWWMAWNRRR
jgi:pyruvate/2-oxoglutarate dehydrogenase complex dihydrolipoamide dehydrogenase (E3) component